VVHRLDHQRIALRPVVASARDEPYADRVSPGHEPVAVVLDLVNQLEPDGGLWAGDERQGSMKLARSAASRARISSTDMPLI
jgi:hypothetical protein